MKNNLSSLALAFLLALFMHGNVKAQIEFIAPDDVDGVVDILVNSSGELFEGPDRFKLRVKCDDPSNNLSGSFDFLLQNSDSVGSQIFQFSNSGSMDFSLNCSGTGKNFSENLSLTQAGIDLVQTATDLGDGLSLPLNIQFNGQSDPGFQQLSIDLNIKTKTDDDDDSDDTAIPELEDGLSSITMPDFGTYTISNTENGNEADLKVTYELKIEKTIYDSVVANLPEGENIEDRAKELADQMGLRVNMRNLRKLARQQVRAAGRGKTGDDKEAAEQEARETGVTQLVDKIVGKLPPLPSSQTDDPEERERLRTIRRARKTNILEALEISLESTTDSTEGETELKCLKFCITLPIRICAASDDSSTLIIGKRRITLRALNPGETITADIPVKVVGKFKKFFGATNKKGKTNGKIDIPIVITSPAE